MKKVVVFGSINLDLVTRISKHPKPGETISGSNFKMFAGGKGANQALVAASQSDIQVTMFGAVGIDSFASSALSNLLNSSLNTEHIKHLQNVSTGIALIAVDDSGENTIIVTPGANHSISSKQLNNSDLKSGDILLTQNELLETATFASHKIAKNTGMIVIHNAAPAHILSPIQLSNIDYLIINETELEIIAKGFGINGTELLETVKLLTQQFNTKLIVTLGEKGAIIASKKGVIHKPATKINVIDTTGAGDAFCGTFAVNIAMGVDLPYALANAVKAGGLACTVFGAQKNS